MSRQRKSDGDGDEKEKPSQALAGTSPSPAEFTSSQPAQQVDPAQVLGKFLLQIQAKLTAEFLGPLPSPETLARFEEIVPGSAAKIMAVAEAQSAHRQYLEKIVVEGDVQKSWYGLWSGLAIGMAGIIGTVILGLFGQTILGGVLAAGTLVSLVSVFVVGTSRRQEERAKLAAAISKATAATSSPPNQSNIRPS